MIYIIKDVNTHDDDEVLTVIETDIAIKKEYKKFMLEEAEKRGIVIHPDWLYIMNHENHPHLTIGEYMEKKKEWYKIQRDNSLLFFILEILKIKPIKFEEIYNVY